MGKTIDATIMHEMGSKLEVKSNCPEFETFIITTTGNKRSVVLNGKELTVVDFQRGARRISQTTELPSGKELKIETNVGEMKLTVRRTPDYFVEFIRMGETMGGKQWGLKIHKNRFSILTGNAA